VQHVPSALVVQQQDAALPAIVWQNPTVFVVPLQQDPAVWVALLQQDATVLVVLQQAVFALLQDPAAFAVLQLFSTTEQLAWHPALVWRLSSSAGSSAGETAIAAASRTVEPNRVMWRIPSR
jgi:hypothetical protein